MSHSCPGAKQQRVDGRHWERHHVAIRIHPFHTAVINFQPPALKIEKRIFIFYLRQEFAGNFDKQPLPGPLAALQHGHLTIPVTLMPAELHRDIIKRDDIAIPSPSMTL